MWGMHTFEEGKDWLRGGTATQERHDLKLMTGDMQCSDCSLKGFGSSDHAWGYA